MEVDLAILRLHRQAEHIVVSKNATNLQRPRTKLFERLSTTANHTLRPP